MEKSKIRVLRVAGIVMMLPGIGFFIAGFVINNKKEHLQNIGTQTEAAVQGEYIRKGHRGAKIYQLQLQYYVEGSLHNNKVKVSEKVYRHGSEHKKLEIKYSSTDPNEIVFVDFPHSSAKYYVAGGVLASFGLMVLIIGFLVKPKEELEKPDRQQSAE